MNLYVTTTGGLTTTPPHIEAVFVNGHSKAEGVYYVTLFIWLGPPPPHSFIYVFIFAGSF